MSRAASPAALLRGVGRGRLRKAARFARLKDVPYFGICFGMQMACIEAARNTAGIKNASSTEFGPTRSRLWA